MTDESLLARLRQMSWPQPPLDTPEVQPGQVWRVAWQNLACLVMTVSAPEGRLVRAVAVSGEPLGDDRTVRVSTDSGVTLNAWSDLVDMVPSFALEQRVGDVAAAELAEVLIAQERPPRAWPAITSIHDDRALFRASLRDALRALTDLDWAAEVGSAGDANLQELAAAHEMTPSKLSKVLSITPGDGRRLLDGRRSLTDGEAEALAAEFGEPVRTSVSFDEDLLVELDRPALRPFLHRRAVQSFDGDEVAVRVATAEFTFALAARHRESGPRNWRALLEDHLRES